jgi:multidrug efflux pump subunit AcrA (membrane-fusion protein)
MGQKMSLKQSLQIKAIKASNDDTQAKMKPKKQVPNWQLCTAIILLLGFGFVLGQKFQPQQLTFKQATAQNQNRQTNILPVKTTIIEPIQSYSTSRTYTGEVTALRTSEVGFERGGKLIQVLVEEGDRLKAGTPLAKLDTANLEAQRQGLTAQKAQAEAILAELENGARSEQIKAAEASVKDIQQQLELEKLKSDRREYLYTEGAIAREQLDEIAFNRKALKERLANAQSRLNELKNGTRIEQIDAQQAAVNRLVKLF